MPENSEPIILDFGIERNVAPRRQNISSRPLKRVLVEFEDGEVLEQDLRHQQGFYRETLTYEETVDGSRVQNRLRIFNVFWTIKEPV